MAASVADCYGIYVHFELYISEGKFIGGYVYCCVFICVLNSYTPLSVGKL